MPEVRDGFGEEYEPRMSATWWIELLLVGFAVVGVAQVKGTLLRMVERILHGHPRVSEV